MYACRLANAHQARLGISKYRYIVDCNVHEGIDPGLPIRISDVCMAEQIDVSELLDRLPLDLRKLVEYS